MNETCPFYTISNTFLSAIVCRCSLNSIYQKSIIRIENRKKEANLRAREKESMCAYMDVLAEEDQVLPTEKIRIYR